MADEAIYGSESGKKIPDEISKLRQGFIPAIMAKRAEFGLNYDIANTILLPIVKAIYTNIRNRVDPESIGFDKASPDKLDAIHDELVKLVGHLAKHNVVITLHQLFGGEPTDKELIKMLFGFPIDENQQINLQKYFSSNIGPLFNLYFTNPPPLAIRFVIYSGKPAISLINIDTEKDLIQYHITISPDRIYRNSNGLEKVQGYHFSNWFFNDGTKVKRSYYLNNGSETVSMKKAKAARSKEIAAAEIAATATKSASSVSNNAITISAINRKAERREEKNRQAAAATERRKQNARAVAEQKAKEEAEAAEIAAKRRHEEELYLSSAIERSIKEKEEYKEAKSAAATLAVVNALAELGRRMYKIRTLEDYYRSTDLSFAKDIFLSLYHSDDEIKKNFYFLMNPDNDTEINKQKLYERLQNFFLTLETDPKRLKKFYKGDKLTEGFSDEEILIYAIKKPLFVIVRQIELYKQLAAFKTEQESEFRNLVRFAQRLLVAGGPNLFNLYNQVKKERKDDLEVQVAEKVAEVVAKFKLESKGGERRTRRRKLLRRSRKAH